MYLVVADYPYETSVNEIKTKKEVKEFIDDNKKDAVSFDIYKVTKKLSADDFQSK